MTSESPDFDPAAAGLGDKNGERRRGLTDRRVGDWKVWMLAMFLTNLIVVAGAVQILITSINDVSKAQKKAENNSVQIRQFKLESAKRRDQTCLSLERSEEASIKQIVRIYKILGDLPSSERGTFIIRATVNGLPQQYAEAEANRAPPYCNEPLGSDPVGVPEPGPKLPKERSFDYLLKP